MLPDPTVTISILAKGIRFAALGSLGQMRLEVFDTNGAPVYNSEFQAGNVQDWALKDNFGQPLPDGSYLCVVTVRDVSGRLGMKQGSVLVQAGQASLKLAEGEQTGAVQSEKALTPVADGNATAVTLLAHDGQQGRVVSGRGGLSFSTGDFFAGTDVEHMRLTIKGDLGIGVENPQARLDVAGPIRTSEGIVFPDGTVQTTAYIASGRSLSERYRLHRDAQGRALAERDDKAAGSEIGVRFAPTISGSGTTGKITKWQDGPNGVVGDSVITESSGKVGIGTPSPINALDVIGTGSFRSSIGNNIWQVTSTGQSQVYDTTSGLETGYASYTHRHAANGGPWPRTFFLGYGATTPGQISNFGLYVAAGQATGGLQIPSSLGLSTNADVKQPASKQMFISQSTIAGGIAIMSAEDPFSGQGTDLFLGGSHQFGVGAPLIIKTSGRVGIGTSNPQVRLDVVGDLQVTGNAVITGNIAAKYQDVAEWVPASQQLAAGTVVSLDATRANAVVPSARAYDTHIAGVVSSRPGVILGQGGEGKVLVATTGRVKVMVDATRRPIKIGDLLVTSDKSGTAMKSQPIRVAGVRIHRPGTILGKALEPLDKGQGEILVLLSLQ